MERYVFFAIVTIKSISFVARGLEKADNEKTQGQPTYFKKGWRPKKKK
ncbi:MAG: hypothetical protein HY887_00760 [Deltaproteobacteria bacterium]|nr:hypothetical protein [Deltaproteobacteria bacterium]